jgi:hypothetical protein
MKPSRIDFPTDVIRPFVLLSALGFATGFWAYLAVWPYVR